MHLKSIQRWIIAKTLQNYLETRPSLGDKTRLSSIESQPKKVIVVFVVVVVVVVVGHVVVVIVVIIVGHRNLTLQFGQNRANNK